tara:strand:+ start:166 stop:1617 length:1452 start_codon:yes stop_codon:yes gene_type:complete
MALTKKQIDSVVKTLIDVFEDSTVNSGKVVYDKQKTITVFVDKEDRIYRKNILKLIQKLFDEMGAKYTIPSGGGKTGAVKLAPIQIEVKPNVKIKNLPTGKVPFKPSNIVPSIVNKWLTPEEMVVNVKKYVNNQESITEVVKKQILKLLNDTVKDTNLFIPFDAPKDLVPAEFYEVLTSIKLAVLLKSNNIKIRKTLGIPNKMDLTKSKIKIKIPQASNYPLVDYFISVSASDKESDPGLRISVKSKVKSPQTNTVKFKDVFEKTADVNDWYNKLDMSTKRTQKGPKIIAESALYVYDNLKGIAASGVPIKALLNIIKVDKAKINLIINLKKYFNNINIDDLQKILTQLHKKIRVVKHNTPLSEIIDDKKLLTSATKMILSNMYTKGGQPVNISFYNMALVCEKILEKTSYETSPTKYNFYQMFFDEVLTKKRVAYAVSRLSGKTLQFSYYSLVNFAQEYSNWLSLRSKGGPNSPTDVIGLNV